MSYLTKRDALIAVLALAALAALPSAVVLLAKYEPPGQGQVVVRDANWFWDIFCRPSRIWRWNDNNVDAHSDDGIHYPPPHVPGPGEGTDV